MNFKNYFMFALLLGLGLIQIDCSAGKYAYLTGITSDFKGEVTIQSSDTQGTIVLKKQGQTGITQDKMYNLKDIESMNFVIPWDGWDGDATIHVRVKDKKGNTVAQADLLDKGSQVIVNNIKKTNPGVYKKQKCTAAPTHYGETGASSGLTGALFGAAADAASSQESCQECDIGISLHIDKTGKITHKLEFTTNCN